MQDFNGKVALITGVTSGIGRAAAVAFAGRGAAVVGTGRRSELGQQLARDIEQSGGRMHFITSDVSLAESHPCVIEETLAQFGRLDFAFNNAGIEGKFRPIEKMPVEDYDAVMDTNARGVWLSMKYQIPAIRSTAGGGAIVNNSSVAGLIGLAGGTAYMATKHAVLGMTKAAALENATQGVRINAICPAGVETEMFERAARAPLPNGTNFAEFMMGLHPVGRVATPEEIASVVCFLCSAESSFMTGVCIPVDGGYTAQ